MPREPSISGPISYTKRLRRHRAVGNEPLPTGPAAPAPAPFWPRPLLAPPRLLLLRGREARGCRLVAADAVRGDHGAAEGLQGEGGKV